MASNRRQFPWDPGYNNQSNATAAVVPPPAPAASPPAAEAVPIVSTNLESALLAAAQEAARAQLPALEAQVLGLVQKTVRGVLPAQPDAPTLSTDDITQAAARSRAFRSLVYGLGLSAVWAIINTVGSLSGVEFFSKTGLVTVGVTLGSAVLNAVISYVGRIKWAPNPVVANSPTAD